MDEGSNQETKAEARVTALIVSYNNAPALRLCLAALELSQGRETLEIIVIDKGSRDGSELIDSEFPHITVLRLPRNFGNAKALNIGMRTAAAELVFFLVPEVEVKPDTVALLAKQLDDDPDAVAVCPVLDKDDQFYRLPTPQTGRELKHIRITMDGEPVIVEGAAFDAMMARKYFVRGLNFLDEKYGEYWADADLCFQIRRSGRKIVALPRVNGTYTPRPDAFPDNALRLMEADGITGGARYFGKYFGFFAGLMFRFKSILKALFSLRLGLVTAALSGRKVDGTQSEL